MLQSQIQSSKKNMPWVKLLLKSDRAATERCETKKLNIHCWCTEGNVPPVTQRKKYQGKEEYWHLGHCWSHGSRDEPDWNLWQLHRHSWSSLDTVVKEYGPQWLRETQRWEKINKSDQAGLPQDRHKDEIKCSFLNHHYYHHMSLHQTRRKAVWSMLSTAKDSPELPGLSSARMMQASSWTARPDRIM